MVFALNMLQSVTSQARSDTLIVFSCSSSTVVLERSSFSALIYQSVTPLRTLGIIQKPHFPRPRLHSIQEHFPSSGYVYLPPSNVSPSHVHEPISSIYHPWIQTIDGFLWGRIHRHHCRSFRCVLGTRASSQGHGQWRVSSRSDEWAVMVEEIESS